MCMNVSTDGDERSIQEEIANTIAFVGNMASEARRWIEMKLVIFVHTHT